MLLGGTMNLRKAIIVFILPTICKATGVMNGGGGKGVLCEIEGNKQSIETLELYESKNIFHLIEENRGQSFEEELALGLNRLNEVWVEPGETPKTVDQKFVEKVKNDFFSKVIFIPNQSRIPITDDATVPVLPTNCKQVQIALYNSLGIQIDKEYWYMMDSRSQAALIFHEFLYYHRRNYGAYNSDETRNFVGRLFSTTPPIKRFLNAPTTGYYDCIAGTVDTPVFDFVVYPFIENGEKGYLISFREIVNATTLGRTITFYKGENLFNYLGDTNSAFSEWLNLQSDFKEENRDLIISKTSSSGPMIIKLKNRYTGETTKDSNLSCFLK